jgi:hypothetical protein
MISSLFIDRPLQLWLGNCGCDHWFLIESIFTELYVHCNEELHSRAVTYYSLYPKKNANMS